MKNNKKGFTLVECIIAISIVTMLSTLAITIFQTTLRTTNDQWNKYQTLQMGENVLACFQASDDDSDFERHLEALQKIGKEKKPFVTLNPSTHNEFDSNNTPLPVPFTKIRAYEDEQRVDVLDGDTALATFTYSDPAVYEKDVHGTVTANTDALDQNEIYDVEPCNKPDISMQTTNFIAFNTTKKKKQITITSNGTTASYRNGDGTKEINDVALNAFEQYLYQKQWYLRSVSASSVTGGTTWVDGTVECLVYKFDNTAVTNANGAQMRIKLYIDGTNTGLALGTTDGNDVWSTYPSQIRLIQYRYGTSGSWLTLKNDDNVSFVGESGSVLGYRFLWMYYPYILSVHGMNSDTKNKDQYFAFSYTPPQSGGLDYTDYTVKEGHTSEIHYALVSNTAAQFFNGTSEDADMLFQYTGDDRTTPLSELTFTHKKDDANCNGIYYRVMGDLPVYRVAFDDTAKKISFLDDKNVVSVFFTNTNNETYQQDKGDICNEDGVYYSLYNADHSLKKPGIVAIRKDTDSFDLVYFQLVVGMEPIFVSYADTISIKNITNANDSFTQVNNNPDQVEETVTAITKYYSFAKGRYVMVAKATFSKYVGSTETEPVLKVWIMSAGDYDAWRPSNDITPEEPATGNLIINYRKG